MRAMRIIYLALTVWLGRTMMGALTGASDRTHCRTNMYFRDARGEPEASAAGQVWRGGGVSAGVL